MGNGETMITNF